MTHRCVIELTADDVDTFERDGFVVVGPVLSTEQVEALRGRFEPLFEGQFATGLQPDEWNWRAGSSADDLTRQICNGWKADPVVAATVLRADIGRACARLRGWPGARLAQDNLIWKPPGTRALGFHQDDSYQGWVVPGEMVTCWMALDDTAADQGTIEYARASHRWPLSPMIDRFHGPDDPLAEVRRAAAAVGTSELSLVPIEIPAGWAAFHHGRTWHGSRANEGRVDRRAIVSHCLSSAARFHETNVNPIYSRYRRHGSTDMDETFFPILWRADGHRTPWL